MIAICMTYYVYFSSLCFFLSNRISQLSMHDTAFRKTRALLSKLIRLTIETGSLTGMYLVFVIVHTYSQHIVQHL